MVYLTLYHTCMKIFINENHVKSTGTELHLKMYSIGCVWWSRINSNWIHKGFEIRCKFVILNYIRCELLLDLHSEKMYCVHKWVLFRQKVNIDLSIFTFSSFFPSFKCHWKICPSLFMNIKNRFWKI